MFTVEQSTQQMLAVATGSPINASLEIAIENGDCHDCELCFAKCYNLGYCRVIENEQDNAKSYNFK